MKHLFSTSNVFGIALQILVVVALAAAAHGLLRNQPEAVAAGKAASTEAPPANQPPVRRITPVAPGSWAAEAGPGSESDQALPAALSTIQLDENPVEILAEQLKALREEAAEAPPGDRENVLSEEEILEMEREGRMAW